MVEETDRSVDCVDENKDLKEDALSEISGDDEEDIPQVQELSWYFKTTPLFKIV